MPKPAYSKRDVRLALAILRYAIVCTTGQIYVAAVNLSLFYTPALRLVSTAWVADEVTRTADGDERRYEQVARCACIENLLREGWLP